VLTISRSSGSADGQHAVLEAGTGRDAPAGLDEAAHHVVASPRGPPSRRSARDFTFDAVFIART
jgi:hypothetical protein